MLNSKLRTFGLVGSLGLSLVACGGGGGGSNPPPPPAGTAEGLWKGTSSVGRSLDGLVLPNGEYWLIYTAVGNNAVIAGAIQGNGTSQSGQFTSANGRDFNLEGQGINPLTISATYVQGQSLNGTATYPGAQFTFTSTFDTAFNLIPTLGAITGTFAGTGYAGGGAEFTQVMISGTGALTGQSASGCRFAGTIATGSGGNYYNVTVTFQGGVCANGTQTVTGVGYFDATTNVFWSAALNAARTSGFLFGGTKS